MVRQHSRINFNNIDNNVITVSECCGGPWVLLWLGVE